LLLEYNSAENLHTAFENKVVAPAREAFRSVTKSGEKRECQMYAMRSPLIEERRRE
jgi:hypothetical protein